MKPAISAVTPSPIKPGPAVAHQHQRQHLVVAVPVGGHSHAFGQQAKRQNGQCQKSRKDDDQRHHHLEGRADDGREPGRAKTIGREHPLHHQKIGSPVPKRQHNAPTQNNAGPVDPHRVVLEMAQRAPKVGVVRSPEIVFDLPRQISPAAHFNHAENGNQQRPRPDQDELQNLIEDCRPQTAQGYVDSDHQRRQPDAEVQVPPQNHLHHQRHRVHIDAAHQDGHEGKADGREGPRRITEAQMEISGNRVCLRNVVERHHDQAQKQHGWYGANPISVQREDAVLIGGTGPAHHLE